MTISHQPPESSSVSDPAKSFRIPSRPSAPPPASQQFPPWQASENGYDPEQTYVPSSREEERQAVLASVAQPKARQGQTLGERAPEASAQSRQAPTTLGPAEPPPALASLQTTRPLPEPTTRVYQRNESPSFPPQVPATTVRRQHGRLYFVLAGLVVLVVLGGLLGQQLLTGNGALAAPSLSSFPSNGPYAQLPLSASQINAIEHLSGHMKYKALASLYVSHMSLDDEIGQLIMVEYNQPSYSSDLDYMLHTLHVGGVIMYEFQMTSFNQTKSDIARMQERANIPLIISTDEEGGPYVHRLNNIYGYRMSATQIEQTGDVNVATQQGLKVSQQMAALGINEDLAPDVDVNQVNGYDMVTRTFGNTTDQVIKFAGPYLQAMQGNGTIGCLKHYPGLGGASPDAHKTLPVVNSSKQQIYDTDLAPFKYFIQSSNPLLNPGMIMPTDVLMPAIDPKYPAELSHIFMTDILRNEFHYDGVVLTDALYMQGITDTWDMYTASVMALQAGDDMLLGANGTQQTIGVINAIKHALQDGQLTKARIDESATRIIALKMQYHLMPAYVPGM